MSGTPAINDPFELSILFNLIRGQINIYSFPLLKSLNSTSECKHELQELGCLRINIFEDIIQVTRIPYGFKQTIESGKKTAYVHKLQPNFEWISDATFCKQIEKILTKYNAELKPNISFKERLTKTNIFPSIIPLNVSNKWHHIRKTNSKIKEIFNTKYDVSENNEDKTKVQNTLQTFKNKIAGLVSHYFGANPNDPESHFPSLLNNNPNGIEVELSDYQFKKYCQSRDIEQELERKGTAEMEEKASYYKVLSRQSLLFSFPPFSKHGVRIERPRMSFIRNELALQDDAKNELEQTSETTEDDFKARVENEYNRRISQSLKNLSKFNFMNKTIESEYNEYDKLQTYMEIYKTMIQENEDAYNNGDVKYLKSMFESKINGKISLKELRTIDIEVKNSLDSIDDNANANIEEVLDVDNLVQPIRSKTEHFASWNTINVVPNQSYTKYKELLSIYYPIQILSPKCDLIFKNILQSNGLSFCYSQFRNVEGLEVFAKMMLAHGFARFGSVESKQTLEKGDACRYRIIEDDKEIWCTGVIEKRYENDFSILRYMNKTMDQIDMVTYEENKKRNIFRACFALWTGTENIEERKAILHEFNDTRVAKEEEPYRMQHIQKTKELFQLKHEQNDMNKIKETQNELTKLNEILQKFYAMRQNKHGEKICVLCTTQSGAEGISLMGVRQVHLFEPYWNKIRETQVIGRARRKYSHYHLPKDEQNVEVFMYVSTLSKEQKRKEWFRGIDKSYVVCSANDDIILKSDYSIETFTREARKYLNSS